MSDAHAHLYPARAARIAAGFSLKAAAKRLGISCAYLAALERGQYHGFAYHQAERASRLYQARLESFLPPKKPGGVRSGRPRKRKGCSASSASGKSTTT